MRLFSKLPGELISLMRALGESADKTNVHAYLIGAYPRSIMLREDCANLEVVATGDCDKMIEYFLKDYSLIRNKNITHDGRYTVLPSPYDDRDFIHIARARHDEKGGMGDILTETFSRGFSIDALAIALCGKDFGIVEDPAGAVQDIKGNVLRIMHRDVFEQDPIFIFKALYYVAKYDLSWDPMTKKIWTDALKNDTHLKLSAKEIKAEIKIIKKEKNGKSVLKLLEGESLPFN